MVTMPAVAAPIPKPTMPCSDSGELNTLCLPTAVERINLQEQSFLVSALQELRWPLGISQGNTFMLCQI